VRVVVKLSTIISIGNIGKKMKGRIEIEKVTRKKRKMT